MATRGERQALFFLAAVAVLGAGTRLYRARRPAVDERALVDQIAAVDSAGERPGPRRRRRAAATQPEAARPASGKIDLDTASAQTIERLPGIGPALAKRIAANRDSGGAFGCLAALDGVKGVGPSLLGRLDTAVTFSGPRRRACER